MRRTTSVMLLCLLTFTQFAFAQSFVPPADPRTRTSVRGQSVAPPVTACGPLPLKFGASQDDIEKFYNNATGVAPMEQAKFLGWKNQKTVSVDWVTAYAAPFRATVGTTVSDTKDPASGTDTSTASDNVMARFTQGGDVYTTIAYPLFACTTTGGDDKTPIPRFYVIAFPRLGMVTPALGTNVPTEVTEFNFDLGAELYADWGTPALKAFAQLRLAAQFVSSQFATTAHLVGGNSFPLHQFSAGVQVAFFRISFFKVIGGPDAPFQEFKSGKLLVQLAPYTF